LLVRARLERRESVELCASLQAEALRKVSLGEVFRQSAVRERAQREPSFHQRRSQDASLAAAIARTTKHKQTLRIELCHQQKLKEKNAQ